MQLDHILSIFIAGVLGGLIGYERLRRSKGAGVRTHFLVGLGSALFMVISKYGFGPSGFEDEVLEVARRYAPKDARIEEMRCETMKVVCG